MTNEQQRLNQLIAGESLSGEDRKWLLEYLEQPGMDALRALLEDKFREDLEAGANISPAISEQLWQRIDAGRRQQETKVHTMFKRRWWAAASVAMLLAASAYFWMYQRQGNAKQSAPVAKAMDIAPGREGAVLTLADGSQVLLDTVQNGVVALQGGAKAVIINGRLAYEGNASSVVYNTMSTPKGRQFQLTLPDGTVAWLNAASSIRYPTLFKGAERRVEVTGEVYFEVAKNARMPFKVNVNNNMDIEVLGTNFNINAYADEAMIRTTLLEGSIRVRGRNTESAVLVPGQQAQLLGETMKVAQNADVKQVVAWKEGFFSFRRANLAEVMRQLSRWYDIEVVYERSALPQWQFTGDIDRSLTFGEVLEGLTRNRVKYRTESGNRIVILQNQ